MRTDAKLHRSKSGLVRDFVIRDSNTTSSVVLVKSLEQFFTRADNYSRDITEYDCIGAGFGIVWYFPKASARLLDANTHK